METPDVVYSYRLRLAPFPAALKADAPTPSVPELIEAILGLEAGRKLATLLSKISVAYPRLLSKRLASRFVVHLYQGDWQERVKSELRETFGQGKFDQVVEDVLLGLGQLVEIGLQSPAIEFSDPVVKHLKEPMTRVSFIAKPEESCHPGKHAVLLSVRHKETGRELVSITFDVQVVDYAFDRVSRPLLSNLAAGFSGLGAVLLFILTLLQKVDTTFGLTSGTAAGLFAAAIHARFVYLFRRPGSTVSAP
jgi:hypothetical protein